MNRRILAKDFLQSVISLLRKANGKAFLTKDKLQLNPPFPIGIITYVIVAKNV
jgi:hypothetical protein